MIIKYYSLSIEPVNIVKREKRAYGESCLKEQIQSANDSFTLI